VVSDISDEELREFLVESNENLDRLDQDLLSLEADPESSETISSIFRTVHTIKGTCGFLGFERLGKVAHEGENLLTKLRDGELAMNDAIADALLALEDALRAMIINISDTGSDGDDDYHGLQERLRALADSASPKEKASVNAFVFAPVKAPELDGEAASNEVAADDVPDEQPQARDASVSAKGEDDHNRQIAAVDQVVRVDVGLLDRLMNLVGELVLARNQVLQLSSVQSDPQLAATTQRLSLITSELQEQVMKTRMQPIANLLNKFPRIVRDLARSCGKKVDLVLDGKETELDRTIIEAVRDPLTHLVRNAVDHGIEAPEERLRLGKPETGVLTISAYHEGGYVNIAVIDDGRGIDTAKLKAKAKSIGLLRDDDLERLSERELLELIFAPGFSTASQVTEVSGRGVGMDVVKTNIEAIGGGVEISSEVGSGTMFKLRIPLTLAIIPALVVETLGERFAIPQISLAELVRIEDGQLASAINFVDDTPVMRRRDRLVPLLDLTEVLELGDPWFRREARAINVAILSLEGGSFGLVVDRIIDTQEIVVKPLGSLVSAIPVFSGATIMGDGKVALILDVAGLARQGGLSIDSKQIMKEESDAGAADGDAVLVVRAGADDRVAIELTEIDRLEQFPSTAIEYLHGRPVVQYRDSIMELTYLADLVGAVRLPDSDCLQVVVPAGTHQRLGVIIDEIIDITSTAHVVDGTAIIGSRITQMVSLRSLMGLEVSSND
jgi:two-component system chemotaxis sensor kinase CheA